MRFRGAALVELLCALTIFVITSTIFIELTNRKMRVLESSNRYLRAVQAADAWASRCRAMPAQELDQIGDRTFAVNGLATRDDTPVGKLFVKRTGDVRRVTVIVRWQTPGMPRPFSVSMETQVVR